MRELFLLDPEVIFFNHGSFGACPRPVFDAYQRWQLELERQPVEFLGRRHDTLMNEARAVLAEYLCADAEDIVFISNATAGINTITRSLKLQPGDEILGTDHEYGAVDRSWQFVCDLTGAKYVRQPMPLPFTTPEAFIERFWEAVTPRTRVIAVSHITSPTALIFPIEEICKRARIEGILTVIDGAHAPGQIPLNLNAIGADFYTGNLHKWLCAPKGAAFLHVRREHHEMIHPLVISWGQNPGASFVTRHQWQGTRDIAPFLTVPDAIEFQRAHYWDEVREQCHALAVETRQRIADLTGLEQIAPESWFAQMCTLPLPPRDVQAFTKKLYEDYKIEIPGVPWNDGTYIRLSFQGYITRADADAVLDALAASL